MGTGTVRGMWEAFGFVTADGTGRDMFVHHTVAEHIQGGLRQGERVVYHATEEAWGGSPRASRIMPIPNGKVVAIRRNLEEPRRDAGEDGGPGRDGAGKDRGPDGGDQGDRGSGGGGGEPATGLRQGKGNPEGWGTVSRNLTESGQLAASSGDAPPSKRTEG